jgi:hypothetical protein
MEAKPPAQDQSDPGAVHAMLTGCLRSITLIGPARASKTLADADRSIPARQQPRAFNQERVQPRRPRLARGRVAQWPKAQPRPVGWLPACSRARAMHEGAGRVGRLSSSDPSRAGAIEPVGLWCSGRPIRPTHVPPAPFFFSFAFFSL